MLPVVSPSDLARHPHEAGSACTTMRTRKDTRSGVGFVYLNMRVPY